MSLSLKLELTADNMVLVTNSEALQQKKVTLKYLQKIMRDNLSILIQYQCYEVNINAQSTWNCVKYFDNQVEEVEQIRLEDKFQEAIGSNSYLTIRKRDKELYDQKLHLADIYDFERDIARTIKVINRLKEFGWQAISKSEEYIFMIKESKQVKLFIPNHHEMTREQFKSVLSDAELSIKEFFSIIH